MNQKTAIDRLLREILQSANITGQAQLNSWRRPKRELEQIAGRDYVRALRRRLDYRALRQILSNAAKVWPKINEVRLNAAPGKRFARMAAERASKLGLHLQANPYDGPEGLALLGFYVENATALLKRPLIYVNTAHHPGAVNTAFLHELGHHLTAKTIDTGRQPVHFFFDADYASHLDDVAELAADIIVSLGGYPQKTARAIFAEPWNWGLVARTGKLSDEVFGKVREHVELRYGLDFAQHIPAEQRLHYLTGMIHYAKLRWALLAEYNL